MNLLHIASQNAHPEAVAWLLEQGLKPNEASTYGDIPLFLLAKKGFSNNYVPMEGDIYRTALALLDGKASTMRRNSSGMFCYHCAAQEGNDEFLRALAERGVKMTKTDEDGNTGLHLIEEACRNPIEALERVDEEIEEKRNEASLPVKRRSPVSMEELQWRRRKIEEELEALFRCAVILIEAGVDPEAENDMLETAYKLAMRAGAKKLSALLNGAYSPDEEESPEAQAKIATGGMTLHEAVRKQDEEAVRTLAGMGEDLNAISEEHGFAGLSPLAVACQTCDVKMAALLLGLGADPSVKNSEGEPAIAALFSQQIMIHAPKKLYEDRLAEQLVDLLVRYGFDPNDSVNDQGDCLLGLACSSLYGRGDGRNSVIDMVVEEAIRQGADVDRKNNMGQTPLMLACAGDFRTMEEVETALLEAGADASIADNQSRTALHMASQAGNKDIIRLLCDNGVDVNGSDQQGKTPLIYAVENGRGEACRLLLELGADKTLTYQNGHNAFDYAAANGMRDVIALLEDEQKKTDDMGNTTLHQACHQNQSEVVEALLKAGRVDVNAVNDDGDTPLLMVCRNQNVYLAEILLKAGADPNCKQLDGSSPLHYAAEEGNYPIAKALLAGGADVNLRDQGGKTPLLLAAREGQNDMVAFLIENGADVNLVSNSQRSALYYATENGFTEIVEQLLMAGAEG